MGLRSLCGLVVLLGGCALSPMMPPLNQSYLRSGASPVFTSGTATPVPSSGAPASSPTWGGRTVEYDSSDNLTRVSIMPHHGKYFLWMQKPQTTFFVVYPGKYPATPPAAVYLVFRTQSPQSVLDNKLILTCNGITSVAPGLPTSQVVPGIQASVHFLTFTLTPESFVAFSRCTSGDIEVGGVHAPFKTNQMEQVRLFAGEFFPTAM